MTIRTLLESAKSRLESPESPRESPESPHESRESLPRKNFICETLLAHFLGQSRTFLHAHSEDSLDLILKDSHKSLETKLFNAISRLNSGYPLEYITNEVSFYSQKFYIDSGALIPRPESELLVDYANALIATKNISEVCEIGVGSGVISIMLCLLNPRLKITASDISREALAVARRNIALKSALDSTLKARIRLIEADLLNGEKLKPNTLLVANPPYIANDYAIPKNLTFEPRIALFGGEKGDEILKRIIALNADFLCCEVGYNQGYLGAFLGAYKSVEFYKDYAGFIRGFVAQKF